MRIRAAVFAMLICLFTTSQGIAEKFLTIEHLLALSSVRDAQINPSGDLVAYTVSTIDTTKDKSQTSIWMAPVRGSTPWRATGPGYSAIRPRWSPAGQQLAFLSSRSSGDEPADTETQVWVFNMRGGDAQPLSHIKQGVDSYEWSPNGKQLLLTIKDPNPDQKDKKKDRPTPHVIDRLQFKRDYTGYLDNRRKHLFVLDLATAELRQLTSGDYDDSNPVWSPDGKTIAFVSNRTVEPDANDNTNLWMVSVDDSLDHNTPLIQLTINPGPDHSPTWSPDGKTIAYITNDQPKLFWYAVEKLAVVDIESSASRILTPDLDRNVNSPQFTANGKKLLFGLEDSGARHVASVRLRGGSIQRVVSGDRSVRSFSQSDKGRLAVISSQSQLPEEVFMAKSGNLRQLTHTNQPVLENVQLGAVQNIHFKNSDGNEIEGFVTFPPRL